MITVFNILLIITLAILILCLIASAICLGYFMFVTIIDDYRKRKREKENDESDY
jgi:hypothetical protein